MLRGYKRGLVPSCVMLLKHGLLNGDEDGFSFQWLLCGIELRMLIFDARAHFADSGLAAALFWWLFWCAGGYFGTSSLLIL
ncbi:hypothetical protein Nepgr_023009 [Nepenthes gracilis]|uniref:Uncharacterized protein n=1 Tax=Nepenthes gracilis TaxID=150966 RepID=A0AAD3T332_NEPGR|nr:hypothetical protein Nepgr_023009 [Nepenthes gracilis]